MNKKFFINILSLFLFVVLLASFVWPKISETLKTRDKQLALKEQIADLDKKTETIESLSQGLAADVENQELVLQYIPSARDDEFLINYLDSVAYAEGVSLSDITISDLPGEVLAPANPESGAALSPEGSEVLPAAVSPKPVFETAEFKLFASYEKIMTLLRKFDGLKRFNEVSSLKIVKTYPKDNNEDAGLNFLQAEWSLDFNHLKKITSQAEIGENLFSQESFDQETLAKIKNKAINGANNPDGKTDGRSNPFTP